MTTINNCERCRKQATQKVRSADGKTHEFCDKHYRESLRDVEMRAYCEHDKPIDSRTPETTCNECLSALLDGEDYDDSTFAHHSGEFAENR